MTTRYLPGDIVLRRKGLVLHKGIALGDGLVLHNTPFAGEHISTDAEFRRGHQLYVRRLTAEERRRTLCAARADARRRYNLFTNNCEHTVTRAQGRKATSGQLQAWVVGAGVAAATLAVTRHPGLAAAGFALGASVGSRVLDLARGRRHG